MIADSAPNYGFRYNAGRDGYEADEVTMAVARRIFRMVGVEGAALRPVQQTLVRETVLIPKGGRNWSRWFLRRLIQEEV